MIFNSPIQHLLLKSFIITTLVKCPVSAGYVNHGSQFCVRDRFTSLYNVSARTEDRATKEPVTSKERNKKQLFNEQIENIISELGNYKWEETEMQCLSKIHNILKGVQNHTLWAIWVWDANQAPVGLLLGSTLQFGSYDACLNPPWLATHPDLKTKYCISDVSLEDQRTTKIDNNPYTAVEKYLKSETKYRIRFRTFTWGLCVPMACEPKSIRKFAEIILYNSLYGFLTSQADITSSSCEGPELAPFSTGFYLSMTVILFFIIAVCVSSIYHKVTMNKRPETLDHPASRMCRAALLLTIGFSDSLKKAELNLGAQIAISFSLIQSNALLFAKSIKNEIRVLHGIRCISMIVELFFHVWVMSDWIGYSDALYFEKQIANMSLIYHMDIVVDSFFVMAGLLFMKSLLESHNINFFMLLVKRYLRCNCLLILFTILSPYLGTYAMFGPVLLKIGKEELNYCKKHWWKNFLTIQNYLDPEYICYPTSWSVAVDFHMVLIGVIIFWLYRKNLRVGVIAFLVLAVASIVLPAIHIYKRGLSGVPKFDLTAHKRFREEFSTEIYLQTHLRMGPYLVGFAFGYIFAIYKPSSYRNVVSEKLSMIGFLVSMAICSSVLMQSAAHYDVSHSAFDSAMFGALNRNIWAFGIGLFVSIAEYGHIPYINGFLGSSFFVPLGKLSYGMYVNNVSIYGIMKIFNTKTSISMNLTLFLLDTAGLAVFSCFGSYLTWLLFEAPVNSIVGLF